MKVSGDIATTLLSEQSQGHDDGGAVGRGIHFCLLQKKPGQLCLQQTQAGQKAGLLLHHLCCFPENRALQRDTALCASAPDEPRLTESSLRAA